MTFKEYLIEKEIIKYICEKFIDQNNINENMLSIKSPKFTPKFTPFSKTVATVTDDISDEVINKILNTKTIDDKETEKIKKLVKFKVKNILNDLTKNIKIVNTNIENVINRWSDNLAINMAKDISPKQFKEFSLKLQKAIEKIIDTLLKDINN